MKKLLITALLILPLTASAVTYPSIRFQATQATSKAYALQLYTSALPNQYDFTFRATASSTLVSGAVAGSTTVQDIVLNNYTGASVDNFCTVSSNAPVTYTSITPSIGTIDQNGSTTIVSNGTAQFNATYNYRTRGVFCAMSNIVGQTTQTLYDFATSSLGYNDYYTTLNLINQSTTSTGLALFSTIDDVHRIYVRNQVQWASTTNLTAIPAANNGVNPRNYNGVLVAPDTMLMASHVGCYSNGEVMYFVAGTSTVISRTVATTTLNVGGTDICIGILTSPIATSTGIWPAPVLASTTFPIISAAGGTCTVPGHQLSCNSLSYKNAPCMYFRQNDGNVYIGQLTSFNIYEYECSIPPTTSPFYNWWHDASGGDSGGPAGYIVNGQFVLGGTLHYAGVAPSNVPYNINAVNTAMTAAGSAYQLTIASTTNLLSF